MMNPVVIGVFYLTLFLKEGMFGSFLLCGRGWLIHWVHSVKSVTANPRSRVNFPALSSIDILRELRSYIAGTAEQEGGGDHVPPICLEL